MNAQFNVKKAEFYDRVKIPDEKENAVQQERDHSDSANQAQPEKDVVRRLPVMAVQQGSVLAEDLRTKRGALLLQAGTIPSGFVLNRLRDLAEANGLSGAIPIRAGCAVGPTTISLTSTSAGCSIAIAMTLAAAGAPSATCIYLPSQVLFQQIIAGHE